MRSVQQFKESCFKTSHFLEIHDKHIEFDAICEDYILCDKKGEAEASMFTYTYLRTNISSTHNRPVIFVFQGGPGAGSASSQLTFYSPWRIKYDENNPEYYPVDRPFELENNPNCILDVCDVVAIDPVGTGYGRILNEERESFYYSIGGDARAIADFIESWLTKYKRWNCPIFIGGTSYGTVRACRVMDELCGGYFFASGKLRAIPVHGLVLSGNATTLDMTGTEIFPDNYPGVPNVVTLLPTMAATKWAHFNGSDTCSLDDYVEKAYRFAVDKIEPLMKNYSEFSADSKRVLAEEMSELTGLPSKDILEVDFQINDICLFAGKLMEDRHLHVGIYNSSMTWEDVENTGMLDPAGDDPAQAAICMAVSSVMKGPFKDILGISFDREYVEINFDANRKWDLNNPKRVFDEVQPRTSAECLNAGMRRNPQMRTLIMEGYYDLCTVYGASRLQLERSGLPKQRVRLEGYPSGHEPWIGTQSADKAEKDIREFLLNIYTGG